jgi:hypothetical protein
MARLISRVLELDELFLPPPPPEPPAPPPPAWLDDLRRVPFIVWIGLLSLGSSLNIPITIFLIVVASVWKILSPHIIIVSPTGRHRPRQRLRRADWSAIRPDLIFDEAGRVGMVGEIATIKRLAQLPDDYVILHDLRVPTDFNPTQLDLVVLGPGGVWCLEVKAWAGRVFGEENDRQWTQVKMYGNKTVKDARENPIQQNAYHCDALHRYLARLGYDLRVQSLVVLTEAEIMKRTNSLVVPLSQVNSWVTVPHGEPLPPVQIDEIASALRPLLGDPARQIFSTASATARHDVQVRRARLAGVAPAVDTAPVSEEPVISAGPSSGKTMARGVRVVLTLVVAVVVMSLVLHYGVNHVFRVLAESTHSKPQTIPISTTLPFAVLMGLKMVWPDRSKRPRRRRG